MVVRVRAQSYAEASDGVVVVVVRVRTLEASLMVGGREEHEIKAQTQALYCAASNDRSSHVHSAFDPTRWMAEDGAKKECWKQAVVAVVARQSGGKVQAAVEAVERQRPVPSHQNHRTYERARVSE